MSEAEVKNTLDGYEVHWKDNQLVISVSRLRVHNSDGRVTGEIEILDEKENSVIYPATSFNFTADLSRSRLAKTLTEKDTRCDWHEILKELSHIVVKSARLGEPVTELFTSDKIKAPKYLLNPLIIENYANVIFGDPGALKSNIAVALAQILQLPWHDNPMGLVAPDKSIKPLYLDWENDFATLQWQTTMLQRGHNLPILSLFYRRCASPLAQDIQQIRKHIQAIGAQMIIIDSLGLASGGELNNTQPAIEFFSALRQLNTTSLILAHNAKDREVKARSIYGNQYFTAQSRNIWEIRKSQEMSSNEADVALFHRKPPPFAQYHHTIGFRIIFETDKMIIQYQEATTVPEFLEGMGRQTRILKLLERGQMSTHDIALKLDLKDNNVTQGLSKLKKEGRVIKLENGNYGLATNEELL